MRISDIHKLRLEARADRACGFIFQGKPEFDPVAVKAPRFANVSCSNCGGDFGPGDGGFSHCENHAHLSAVAS